jgi:hypothetical protein
MPLTLLIPNPRTSFNYQQLDMESVAKLILVLALMGQKKQSKASIKGNHHEDMLR